MLTLGKTCTLIADGGGSVKPFAHHAAPHLACPSNSFQLIFCTNVDLLYGITDNCVISENFTVGIGPTAYLEVDVQPEFAQGGMDFGQQPVVLLKDAGGNVNFYDSESTVTVSIEVHNTARLRLL